MTFNRLLHSCFATARAGALLAAGLLVSTQAAHAQAVPTATQDLRFSAFGGVTGTYTGLGSGKNLGITAGFDIGLRSFKRFVPALELRGTYPIKSGQVDGQENVLGGIRVSRTYGRLHPYIDALIGRGLINYQNGGQPDPTFTILYLSNPTTVYGPGAGLDVDVTEHFAFKADVQYQHYSTPGDGVRAYLVEADHRRRDLSLRLCTSPQAQSIKVLRNE